MRIRNLFILHIFLATFSCTPEKQPREPFTFVQMCDTQLGKSDYYGDAKRFELAVKQINELAPDFVVICGDLVHNASDSSYAEFKRILDGFEIRWYLTPGNHDVGGQPNDTTLSYYRSVIGDDYYSFHNKGCSFIVTNTQLWGAGAEGESARHDDWFKHTLDSVGRLDIPVFVVGHYPLYLKSPKDDYATFPAVKRNELLSLFRENNVVAYLSRHTHRTIVNDYKGIQLVCGETTSEQFDEQPLGFRLWQVSADTVTHRNVALDVE